MDFFIHYYFFPPFFYFPNHRWTGEKNARYSKFKFQSQFNSLNWNFKGKVGTRRSNIFFFNRNETVLRHSLFDLSILWINHPFTRTGVTGGGGEWNKYFETWQASLHEVNCIVNRIAIRIWGRRMVIWMYHNTGTQFP